MRFSGAFQAPISFSLTSNKAITLVPGVGKTSEVCKQETQRVWGGNPMLVPRRLLIENGRNFRK